MLILFFRLDPLDTRILPRSYPVPYHLRIKRHKTRLRKQILMNPASPRPPHALKILRVLCERQRGHAVAQQLYRPT